MNTSKILVLILGFALTSAGCAKLATNSGGGTTQSVVGALAQNLELPVPDNSYQAQSSAQVVPSAPNNNHVANLMTTVINPVAVGLQERNMFLVQTVTKGTASNNNLTYTNGALGTILSATVASGSLTYNMKLNNAPYFSGTIPVGGGSGSFSFAASTGTTVWAPFSVNYTNQADSAGDVLTTIVVNNTSAGTLTFHVSYPAGSSNPSQITMVGTVSGKSVSGSWVLGGAGFFIDLSGVKECFQFSGGTLQDTTGC